MQLQGQVIKYGDHVDTDVIIPARYLEKFDNATLAAHCMEDLDPTFSQRVKPGDIMVAGVNFGCGSSREHAPMALKAAGISCVIAKSFARIFFRNAINIGLPIIESEEAVNALQDGDTVKIDLANGTIVSNGKVITIQAFPAFLQDIIAAGGLIKSLTK